MRIVFLGTGVAVGFGKKAQQSILIEDDRIVLVDCGFGTMVRLQEHNIATDELDAIVITHFHLDHCGELLGILKARWLSDCEKIDVFTPEGGESFMDSMLNSSPYLINKLRFKIREIGSGESFSVGGLRFTAIKTRHSIESMGIKTGDLLISGDTSAFPELYEDVSYVIHEMSLDFGGKADFHTSPENFAENAVGIRKAFLIHMYPPAYNNRMNIANYLEKHGISAEFPDDLRVLEF